MKRLLAAVVIAASAIGSAHIDIDHVPAAEVRLDTPFTTVPAPTRQSAASDSEFTVIDGASQEGSGPLQCLRDGRMQTTLDSPGQNFFFAHGTLEGRLRIDLHRVIPIAAVNTYSLHKDTRAAQVYKLYGSDGTLPGFNPAPKIGTDPARCGWTRIAMVDTRPAHGKHLGGRDGVSISDPSGTLGNYRYLLFEMFVTEADDNWGHTFYSEINVIAKR